MAYFGVTSLIWSRFTTDDFMNLSRISTTEAVWKIQLCNCMKIKKQEKKT